jgi:hypothetical protein
VENGDRGASEFALVLFPRAAQNVETPGTDACAKTCGMAILAMI